MKKYYATIEEARKIMENPPMVLNEETYCKVIDTAYKFLWLSHKKAITVIAILITGRFKRISNGLYDFIMAPTSTIINKIPQVEMALNNHKKIKFSLYDENNNFLKVVKIK